MSDVGALASNDQKLVRVEVLNAVNAIIASGVLGTGDRRANLLRYLVHEELEGRGSEIKAFSIAIDVLGRDASFDPNTDSIVRSEIGRLRDALRLFFAGSASSSDIRIVIPKGTYRPDISSQTAKKEPRFAPRVTRVALFGLCLVALITSVSIFYKNSQSGPAEALANRVPISKLPYDLVRIAVAPFAGTGSTPDADELAFGIYSELSTGLSAYPWISVVSPVGGFERLSASQVDYVLVGDVHWNADSILTSARLVGIDDEQLVWSDNQTLTADPASIRKSITGVASQIAFELGSIHGISPELAKVRNAESSPENLAAFICFLQSYSYISQPTDGGHLALRECLSEAVAKFPGFGDGWAALALVYIDEARFHRNNRTDKDPWQDAKHAMEQALKYAPLRMPTLNVALILSIEAPVQDRAAFERYASLLLRLYPFHPATLNNVGSRMAEFTGEWEKGLALINEAIYLTPDPPSSFFVTQAYRAAVLGSAKGALLSVAPLTVTTSESQLLLKYLAAARNGLVADMIGYRDLLGQQGLLEDEDIIRHVLNRRYIDEIETALINQLESAFKTEAVQ